LAASCLRIWNNRRNLFGGFNGKRKVVLFLYVGANRRTNFGWSFGTALGAFTSSALPESLSNAMGIALFAMFIAIIVPPAKKSRPVLMIVLISVAINLALKYIPLLALFQAVLLLLFPPYLVPESVPPYGP